MKNLLIGVVAVMLVAGSAAAATCGPKTWDDMSWWGNGATPEPYPDQGAAGCPGSEPRSCYWWWPAEPDTNADDTELWGNRGVVYHCWQKPPTPPPPPPPPPPEKPTDVRKMILLNNVLFDFDKAVLKPEGKAEVDKLINEMKAHAGDTVVVEGHTCDLGSEAYNVGLGQRRADAVKNYMVESGIAAERVTATSLGETTPAVPNDGEPNRKLNRRAQFNMTLGAE